MPAAATIFLLAAAVAFYVAGRAVADAAGRRAVLGVTLAAAVPALAGGAIAVALGRSGAALSFVAGVAVAAVTLAAGLALTTRADADAAVDATDPAPAAATLLPAAIALLAGGFGGTLGIVTCLLLLAVGVALLAAAWPTLVGSESAGGRAVRLAQLVLAALLAAGAAGLAGVGVEPLDVRAGRDLSATSATVIIAPMVALPLIGVVTSLAASGRRATATAGLSLAAAATVGVVLPLTALAAALVNGGEIVMPFRLWRVDAVVLAVVGLLLLPAAARRWRPGGWEGLGLILLYVAYLVVTVASAR